MKKIFLFIIILFAPFCFAMAEESSWDGTNEQGEYLFPQVLLNYCGIEYEAFADDDSLIEDCLIKLQKDRQLDKYGIRKISENVMQDYFIYAVANSSKTKLEASKFIPEVVLREVEKGDNVDPDSEVGDNINQISFSLRDNARLMNSFLQQYNSIVATNAYRVYHQEAIIEAPIIYDNDEGINPYMQDIVPVPEFDSPEPEKEEIDLSVPSEYAKLAPNCGDYEAEAIKENVDVSVVLDKCLTQRSENLAQSITIRYNKELAEIETLEEDYKKEYEDNSTKIEETEASLKEDYAKDLAKIDEKIAENDSVYRAATQELNNQLQAASSTSESGAIKKEITDLKNEFVDKEALLNNERKDLVFEWDAKIEDEITELVIKRDLKKRERDSIIYSKRSELDSWYEVEMNKIKNIILGGG